MHLFFSVVFCFVSVPGYDDTARRQALDSGKKKKSEHDRKVRLITEKNYQARQTAKQKRLEEQKRKEAEKKREEEEKAAAAKKTEVAEALFGWVSDPNLKWIVFDVTVFVPNNLCFKIMSKIVKIFH